MRLSARIAAAQHQPALKRRSDQSSRRMLGRWMAQPVRPGIVLQRRNPAGANEWTECSRRRTGEAYHHATRHKDALVAIHRHRSLRWTAWHVACHRIRRFRRRHLLRHGLHRSVGRYPGRDRPSHRSQSKAGDCQYRQQPAHSESAFHRPKLSQTSGHGKSSRLTSREFYRNINRINSMSALLRRFCGDGAPVPVAARQDAEPTIWLRLGYLRKRPIG